MSMTKRENALGVARREELQSNSPDEHDESRGCTSLFWGRLAAQMGVAEAIRARETQDRLLAEGLRAMVRALVEDINRERGEDYLYFAEFAGVWLLLAKQKDKCDRRVDFGFLSAADLARVADTLQKALEGEIEI